MPRIKHQSQRAQPIPIDEDNYWDQQVKHFTKKGFTVPRIAAITHLTESQVSGRQHKMNVSAMDYRRGISPEARREIYQVNAMLDRMAHLCRSKAEARKHRRQREIDKTIVGSGVKKPSD